jgi:hypothetical protein
VCSSGVPALDEQIGGGWRQGELSEVTGSRSTGRTSVLLATLAAATSRGGVAALVDATDRLDPRSAAAAGVDLARLLWVRGPALTMELARPMPPRPMMEEAVHRAIRAFDLILRAGGFSVAALDLADVPPRVVRALPWATWLRLAHANEGRPTSGLLIGEAPMGRSARGVSVALSGSPIWIGASDQSRQLEGIQIRTDAPGRACREPWREPRSVADRPPVSGSPHTRRG